MGTYDLSPSKDVYRSMQSDVTPITAIKELVDNSIDNWKRVKDCEEPLEIEIEFDESEDKLIVRDNGGGIEEEKVPVLFSIGRSTKDQIDTPIGAYGMGGKKAIVKLGTAANIKSRHLNADHGYGFFVDDNWLDRSGDWDVEKIEHDDLNPGVTVIEIQGLKDDLNEYKDELLNELKDTYELFLSDDLSILYQGDEIKPPEPIEWSFPPFDGLHPRRYENIKIEKDDLEYPVFLHITVGLLVSGSSEHAGTDVFCQNRKVLSAEKGEKGGFGSGDNRIGNWGTHQIRLKARVEFEIAGEADRLPWDTQKSDVDIYNPIFSEAFNRWVSRIVKPYWQAGYREVPSTFLSPYDKDNKHSVNSGQIPSLNYQGRVNVTDKPDTNFSAIEEMNDIIEDHLELRVHCAKPINSAKRPAYDKRFQWYVDNDDELDSEEIVKLRECPNDLSVDELSNQLSNVEDRVEEHIQKEVKFDDLDIWWFPFYRKRLEEAYSGEVDDLTPVDSPTISSSDNDESGKSGEDKKESETEEESKDEDSETSNDDTEESEEREEEEADSGDRNEPRALLEELGLEDSEELVELLSETVSLRNEELRENVRVLKTEKEQLEDAKIRAEKELRDREERRKSRVDEMKFRVSDFERKLDNEEWEGVYQDFLKQNPWFFGAGKYLDLDDEIGPWAGDRNDFLIRGTDGYHDIVELKRPDHPLFWEDKPERITNELRDALCQLARYLHNYETGHLFVESRMEQKILKPGGIIIIGRRKEDTSENIKRLSSILNGDIEILTYDDLKDRAESAISHYENLSPTDDEKQAASR